MKKISVVLFAVVLASVWSVAAFAEAKPYASVRFQTFYKNVSDEDGSGGDSTDLLFGLYGSSRVGVKFKVSDQVSGMVELSLKDSDNGNAVGLRHAFGQYDFGPGKLLIGQTWAPYTTFFPVIYNDAAGGDYGSAANRAAQIRVVLDNGFYVALIDNTLGSSDDDVEIPEVAVGYKGKAGVVSFGLHGAYVTADDTTPIDEESWALMGDLEAKLAMAKLKARIVYGDDTKNLLGGGFKLGSTGGDLNTLGLFLSATFYPSDLLAVSVGGAYNETEAASGQDDDEALVFVNAPIKLTKGFTIVPEIAYQLGLDKAGSGDDDNTLWVGAKWQFDL